MSIVSTRGESQPVVHQTCSTEEWRRFVSSCPSATIYHLPEWSTVLEKSFGYTPFHLFARHADGRLLGILPLFQVKGLLGGRRLVSLPFSYVCGPIGDSDTTVTALLEAARGLRAELKSRYLEIRMADNAQLRSLDSSQPNGGFDVSDRFSTFVLDLSQPDRVWRQLDPKSVRWAIGKARKEGVKIRRSESAEDIESFYRLNLRTKKRIGVPGHPKRLFTNMFEQMGDRSSLYLAELGDEIIGGIVTMKFNDTVLYAYGASDDRHRARQPNSLLVWTAIEEACKEGYRRFDFGRTSPAERSVTSFKKHWGTEEKMLFYFYSPQVPNSMAMNDASRTFQMATRVWRKLPLRVAQICGDMVFGHLG